VTTTPTGERIAVIPARGGSKRIPRKNIRPFHGRPMLAWPIAAAQASGLFDHIVVSTDDAEIAEAARACGAETPFLRPAELADDHGGVAPVVRHAIETLDSKPDLVCLIYSTAATLQPGALREGYAALTARPDKAYALSVTSFPAPIQRGLRIAADGALEALHPEHRLTRSQDLEPAYHDAGQFCWGRTEAWLTGAPIFSDASLPVVLPRWLVQDVDTEEDWRRAELMFAGLDFPSPPAGEG
jgi:pseudaminic acid cytidylyltransferase